ncbi:PQQ-dependent sugar dehydrogenase [Sphingomicrobium nitratireducens]|uniref:PQQ-dependent sugar dehydrogenase n=1 Tax=Sphingomicrobium nitratireducens TaxID=2964666 RepID=UPI002240AA79|nr:PQQ-dependent sugar dehydrogenase [Sphingomicrobium nitratireducens]
MRMTIGLAAAALTACSSGTSTAAEDRVSPGRPFEVEELATFEEPWAGAFVPGTNVLFVTEKVGGLRWIDVKDGRQGRVTEGLPTIDYGGQGGLGDIAFSPTYAVENPGNVYLTWVEGGQDGMRGAVLGRGHILCEGDDRCRLSGLEVLWRQVKTQGRGHFSHRIAFSPDGQFLFLTSGDRQKGEPAQDFETNLGKVLRLTLDGKPAPGNPWEEMGGRAAEFWSMGHRNMLGIEFAPDGRLWAIEMGPRGGDELNLIEAGKNYGWPEVSEGSEYSGIGIPAHDTRPGFVPPKAFWNPSLSPGGFTIYDGDLFEGWKGDAILGGLSGEALVRVDLDGDGATKLDRWDFGERLRAVIEGPDGALYILTDGNEGELLRLTPSG